MVLLVFLLIGAVSAAEDIGIDDIDDIDNFDAFLKDVKFFDKDTNVSLNEFTFTIPEGFGPIEALSFNESDDGLDQSLKFFVNDKEQVIMTSLVHYEGINTNLDDYAPDDNDWEKVTIKNHEGIKWRDDGYSFFTYLDGDNAIVIEAPDDSYLEGIIN